MNRSFRTSDSHSSILLDAVACSIFVVLSFVVFAPELVLGLKVVDGDLYRQVVPTTAWYGNAANLGHDFLWTPGILGGFPIAFSQYGLLFPVDWVIARILDPDRALALNLALHLPLAGIATYLYGRSIGFSRLPSLLAGIGFQLSTESLALGIGGYLLRSLFLLPTLLLSVELIARRGVGWAFLAAAAVAASLLSGTAYIVAIFMLNAGVYTVARSIWLWKKGLREHAVQLLGSMGGAVLLGTGLAAVRVLPTLAVTSESVRANGLSFDVAAGGSTSLGLLLSGYLLPLTRMEGVGGGDMPSYVGPMVVALAIVAILLGRRGFFTGVFAGLLLFNLLASLGSNSPVYGMIHQIPPFLDFRSPSRFSVGSAFFLSVLAAQGVERLAELDPWSSWWRWGLKVGGFLATILAGTAVLSGLLWIYGGDSGATVRGFVEGHHLGPLNPLRPRVFLSLAAIPATVWLLYGRVAGRLSRVSFHLFSLCLTAGLLLTIGLAMMQFKSPDPGPPATARFLQQDTSSFRVMSFWPTISYYHYLSFLAQGDPAREERDTPRGEDFKYRYMRETLAPNFSLQYGLESIDGYEVLQSTRQAIAMKYFGSEKAEEIDSARGVSPEVQELARKLELVGSRNLMDRMAVFRAFNVKYVLTNLQLAQHSDQLRQVFASQIPMLDPRTMTEVYVYQVLGALPRAYLVPESTVAKDESQALDWITAGRVDPARTVILEQPAATASQETPLDPTHSSVEVGSYENSQLTLQIQSSGSGFLVVNDAFYPGWRAWVDGREAPVYVANGWVRAVPIDSAGHHIVHFAYVPSLFREGMWVSLGALMLWVAGAVISVYRWRRSQPERRQSLDGLDGRREFVS